MSAPELLVVEDDEAIGRHLLDALRGQGYRVRWAPTARAARAAVAEGGRVDLVLLDLGLPDLDGTALCRELRAELPDTVIVALTARSEEIDVVLGLDAGANDYLTKPFRLLELLARVRAHLRRRAPATEAARRVEVGRLRVDPVTRRVTVGGREVALRPKEFDLLAVLAGAAGQALSRERLMAEVWDANWFGSTKTLDMHVSALRRKLAEAGGDPEAITTLRGYGYRYELPG
ncbi:MAG TPA: response regulator transcription factor [Frankiaceae bacterium]|nr:response regulator transcription factor [Frankiaceae bacterium]